MMKKRAIKWAYLLLDINTEFVRAVMGVPANCNNGNQIGELITTLRCNSFCKLNVKYLMEIRLMILFHHS